MIKLFDHQEAALVETEGKNRVAYYHDMGLGKTFTGAEKMMQLSAKINLVICQKSKIEDWVNHFRDNYESSNNMQIYDCTMWGKSDWLLMKSDPEFEKDAHMQDITVLVINYELAFRRPELKKLKDFTLMLDESSLIQNETAKRSKFILNLKPANVILLSGTPTGGKYEKLWSQMNLLGWKITKDTFYNQYIKYHYDDSNGFPLMIIDGYKNEERLKRKMRQHGCHFLKTDEVFDLPDQIHQTIKIPVIKEYQKFRKDSIVLLDEEIELVGDTTLTQMLYERQLCGQYNSEKLEAFRDLIESTEDRLIVFYNFTEEMKSLYKIAHEEFDRPCSLVNGSIKNLEAYEHCEDSVTFIQYQAGAMGLNLQKANKIVYFTPPLSSELFEQSKKRIHRIGQEKPCFYYYLTCRYSIEEKIYKTLEMRRDYTEALFEEGE